MATATFIPGTRISDQTITDMFGDRIGKRSVQVIDRTKAKKILGFDLGPGNYGRVRSGGESLIVRRARGRNNWFVL